MLFYLRLYLARLPLRSIVMRGLLILVLAGPSLLALAPVTVQAAPGGAVYLAPAPPADPLRSLILKLGGDVIALLLFIAGVILTVSIAKGGLDAQINTLVGSPMGVSKAWMNLISSVVTGVLTLLSPLLVISIFNALAGAVTATDISVPAPSVTLH